MKPIIVSAIISSGGTVLAALIAAWSVRSVRGGDGGGDGRPTTQAGTSQGPHSPQTPLAEERPSQEFEREIVREKQRGCLAIVLVFILLAVVLVSLWYVLTAANAFGGQFSTILALIGSLLAPLVGLLGAVTGFYYGVQSAVQGSQTATQATAQAAQAAENVTRAPTQAARRQPGPEQTGTEQPGTEQPGRDG